MASWLWRYFEYFDSYKKQKYQRITQKGTIQPSLFPFDQVVSKNMLLTYHVGRRWWTQSELIKGKTTEPQIIIAKYSVF
jgi:hypothetical protein